MSAFAQHLEGMKDSPLNKEHKIITICQFNGRTRFEFEVIIPQWIIEELPIKFKEWTYDENGDPIMVGANPDEDNTGSIFHFFDLSPEEFCHILDVEGFQDIEEYGGNPLNENSQPFDFAQNIKGIVRQWLLSNTNNKS